MAAGDVSEVTTGESSDLYYVDTGMYGTDEYGCVYILDADRPALVESGIGADYDRILDALDVLGIARDDLDVIALTHVHLDHAGGAGFLAETCRNATVAVHELGARHLVDPSRLWEGTKAAVGDQIEFYAEPDPVPEGRIRELEGGDEIDLGDRTLAVHHAPGHAPHQVVFEDDADDCVFTADAAGIYVPSLDAVDPTTPPPQFDLEQALADLELIADLDPSTLCYTHFGPAPTGDRLEEYAAVLEQWVETVAETREEVGDDEAVIDHLVENRDPALDDVWSERKNRGETALNVRGALAYLDHQE